MNTIEEIYYPPVYDGEGNRYIPDGAVLYDGVVMRCGAKKAEADEGSFILESFRPHIFLRRPQERGGLDRSLDKDFQAARRYFLQRVWMRDAVNQTVEAERAVPFVLPFRPCGEAQGTLVIETGSGETVREFVKKNRRAALSASYVLQCLDIIRCLSETLQTLRRDWLTPRFSPDAVFIPSGVDGVRLTDAAFLFPRSETSARFFSLPTEGWLPADAFMYPPLLEALEKHVVQRQQPSCLLSLMETAGLYSISQLLCFMLFVRPWTLDAETVSIRFPSVGIFQNDAVREALEDLVSLGLGMRAEAPATEALDRFSRLLERSRKFVAESRSFFPGKELSFVRNFSVDETVRL